MANKKAPKPHIKQAAFADENFSALEAHPRKGKTLSSPYSNLPSVNFSSWKDDFLPNMLWATVVTSALPRDDYLKTFRAVVGQLQKTSNQENVLLTHNWLAALSREDFLVVMEPLKLFPAAYSALSSLRLIQSLPDLGHWEAFTAEAIPENGWSILGREIGLSFFHQSQTATDLRWLKVINLLLSGRVSFGDGLKERIEEFRLYPNHGEMTSVRPSIRAFEMTIRDLERGAERPPEIPDFDAEAFWTECRAKTDCIVEPKHDFNGDQDRGKLLDQLTEASIALSDHADDVAPSTGVDARRDAAFGMTLYAINIVMEAASSKSHILAGGRSLLRTVVEAVITLRYLAAKDHPTIWMQYRNFGMGQAKLAFLKNVREEDVPEFVSLEDMRDIANDDTWLEFLDIDLGTWEKLNLREMSAVGDIKDIYDKYYSWASGFTHAQWNAVRDTAFTTCFNPLHRFHRVFFPSRQMPSVLPDCCRLINRMLDDVNKLYPGIEARLTWHKQSDKPSPPTEGPRTD